MVKRSASSWLLLFASFFTAFLILFALFNLVPVWFFLVLLVGLTPIVYLTVRALLTAGSSYGRPAKLKSRL